MSKLHCIGCGGELQNTDETKPFYTPKSLDADETIYCQRCFKMRHYGKVIPTFLNEQDYQMMLDNIDPNGLLVQVVDIFDIEGSLIPAITRLATEKNLIVVANKRDLLPKSVKNAKLKHRLNAILHQEGLKPLTIELTSAVKNHGIDSLIETISKHAKGRDVYFIGATNVGKSTLINHMISAAARKKSEPITTFFAPGTTQGFIEIPFDDIHVYDTPGLFKKNHFFQILSGDALKKIQPRKEINPRVYQLEVNQTIFIGGLVRIDFLKGLPSQFVFYCGNDVPLHRTKMINADNFYDKHLHHLLVPPFEGEEPMDFRVNQIPLKRDTKTDIIFPGLGFVSVKGIGVLRVYAPKEITPYHREALI